MLGQWARLYAGEATERFWEWYRRNYVLNVGIAAGLFIWQLIHLYWLGADVISERLIHHSQFHPEGIWRVIIILVDYTEIPAIISTSLLYIYELREKWRWHILGLLLMLNSQWLHIFWITDEFVVGKFSGAEADMLLPVWLAWIAILIDYAELPVIVDIVRRFFRALRERRVKEFAQKELALKQ